MSRTSSICLLGLFVSLCFVGAVSGAMNLGGRDSSPRQAPSVSSSSTSLATSASSSINSLSKILLPAFQTLIGAPFQLLRQFLIELNGYLRNHSLSEVYSMQTLRLLASNMPERLHTYWIMLMEMESQCMHRTICDLADYTSRRVPKWFEQILIIYLNNFSGSHPYYQVIINGLTTHQCKAMYAECDSQQFLARVKSNLTDSIATTVAPVKQALEGLIGVTTTTLSSLIEDSDARPNVRPGAAVSIPRPNQFNDEEEEEDDEERRFGPGRQLQGSSRGNFNGGSRQPSMAPAPMVETMRRQDAFLRH